MADVHVYTYDSLATEQNHVQGELKTPESWCKGKSMMKAHGHLPEHNDTHTHTRDGRDGGRVKGEKERKEEREKERASVESKAGFVLIYSVLQFVTALFSIL